MVGPLLRDREIKDVPPESLQINLFRINSQCQAQAFLSLANIAFHTCISYVISVLRRQRSIILILIERKHELTTIGTPSPSSSIRRGDCSRQLAYRADEHVEVLDTSSVRLSRMPRISQWTECLQSVDRLMDTLWGLQLKMDTPQKNAPVKWEKRDFISTGFRWWWIRFTISPLIINFMNHRRTMVPARDSLMRNLSWL